MRVFATTALLVCASAAGLHAGQFASADQSARAVIGQYEFTGKQITPGIQIIGGAGGLAYANGELWVADGNLIGDVPINNRVLGFPVGSQVPAPAAVITGSPTNDLACLVCGFAADTVLGQADFVSTTAGRTQAATSGGAGSMNTATAVATDGKRLAVADTDNDRILIWNSVPSGANQPPDLVLGQPDFTTLNNPANVSASSLRVPNGVWIDQTGRLYVADTGNSRVLIWNRFPTSNDQPADVVLGQANFTSVNAPSLTSNPSSITTAANLLWDPTSVSVSPDGNHLIVADFGYNRILIWNSIPTQNQQAADVVLGQSDMSGAQANPSSSLCASNGTDSSGHPTFPARCATTFDHPRFAIADNNYLYVADTGNDRVLLFNGMPTSNHPSANLVIGQPDFQADVDVVNRNLVTSAVDNTGSVDTTPQPLSLAVDGTNLYVADPSNHRVLVFTPADMPVAGKQVLNNASKIVHQEGLIVLAGTPTSGDTVTVTISGTSYTYTIKSGDTVAAVVTGVVTAVNASSGDPNAVAYADTAHNTVLLLSKNPNADLNTIAYSATTSNTTNMTATAAGQYLAGGNSGTLAPGALVEIDDPNVDSSGNPLSGMAFSDFTLTEPTTSTLPTTAQNPSNPASQVQVYVDGIAVPIFSVSPTQVVVQIPYTFENPSNGYAVDRNSISSYVRWQHADGTVTVSTAAPAAFTEANPGLFAQPGASEPRLAVMVYHQAGNPSTSVQINGSATANDKIAVTVSSATYTYTVVSGDTLSSIAQKLAAQIDADPNVTATAVGGSTVTLSARQSGSAGTGISVSATVTAASSGGTATETATVTNSKTCCAQTGSGAVTPQKPAQPNEVILFTATGLGNVSDVNGNVVPTTQGGNSSNPAPQYAAGTPYSGPIPNSVTNTINATVSGSTASVISASLGPNPVTKQNIPGYYTVALQMPSSLPTSGIATVYIAQNAFISNTVSIPVGTPVSASTSTVYTGQTGKWASLQTGVGTLPSTSSNASAPGSTAAATSSSGTTAAAPVYVPYLGAFPVIPGSTAESNASAPTAPSTEASAPQSVPDIESPRSSTEINTEPPPAAAQETPAASPGTSASPEKAEGKTDESATRASTPTASVKTAVSTTAKASRNTTSRRSTIAHKSKSKAGVAKRAKQQQPHSAVGQSVKGGQ